MKPPIPKLTYGGYTFRKVRTQRCDLCMRKRNVIRIDKQVHHPGYPQRTDALRMHICSACLMQGALCLTEESRKEN